ncbi:putative ion channel CASTOR [Platanthera zijinensis]|uniref:Ion channel CASTOR n=1 Tax=Platanthera zijinensis TaxID=2320716 RepID=A0AAP0ASE7_9ASPA
MSFDSDSSPPANNRDWFFPATSPFYSPRAPGITNRSLNPKRRPSAFPVAETVPRSYLREARPQQRFPAPGTWMSFGSHASTSPATSTVSEPAATIPRGDPRYAGVRRKVRFDTREEKGNRPGPVGAAAAGDEPAAAASGCRRNGVWRRLVGRRVGLRLSLGISLAFVLLVFISIVQKNFSLNKQVNLLQDQLSKQKTRLQECDLYDPAYFVDIESSEANHLLEKSLKNSALFVSLSILCIPLIVLRHLDSISRLRKSPNSEEISLSKQLAYKVDVFLSVYPFSKPLTLLLATLLLICLGGLALFGVTEGTLTDSLWLSWTYVADSGNHANSVGAGPKLVSVSISFGGMLIFAMMLGLVSDAISEKFDSLRRAEVK